MPHDILLTKLNPDFGVTGSFLDLICNYLSGRQQFTVLNGVKLELLPVRMGIPQGSVLRPMLSVLFTNNLPSLAGLQIMAGQRTMSGQNWVLTGQILGLPDTLSGPLPTSSEKF